jgi:hypothetical protein
MRVRIQLVPSGDGWGVEVKTAWWLSWRWVESFYGDNAEQLALAYARRLKRPTIVEVE